MNDIMNQLSELAEARGKAIAYKEILDYIGVRSDLKLISVIDVLDFIKERMDFKHETEK